MLIVGANLILGQTATFGMGVSRRICARLTPDEVSLTSTFPTGPLEWTDGRDGSRVAADVGSIGRMNRYERVAILDSSQRTIQRAGSAEANGQGSQV